MVVSSNSLVGWALALCLVLVAPTAWAATVFCEDTTACSAGQACVEGVCIEPTRVAVAPLFPVAVDRIRASSEAGRVLARRVGQRLRQQLRFTGFFTLLPVAVHPPTAALESLRHTTIDFDRWARAGAWAVIKGELIESSRGAVLRLALFRTEHADAVRLGKRDVVVDLTTPATLDRAVTVWVDRMLRRFAGGRPLLTSRIAFAHRATRAAPKQIRVMSLDGIERAVTDNPSINVLPSWTPNGRVVWTSFVGGNPDLYVDHEKLSARPGMNTGAAYHPSGRTLAVTLSRDGNAEIYVLDAKTGREKRRLTDHPSIDTSPTWSPDGKALAFVSDRATGRPQLFRMNAKGGDVERLPQAGGYNASPEWSPAGDRIVYQSMVGAERYDLYSLHVSSGELTRLTDRGSNEEPSFSPNGRFLVFSRTLNGDQTLWIMTADGRLSRQISTGPGRYMTPAWERPPLGLDGP